MAPNFGYKSISSILSSRYQDVCAPDAHAGCIIVRHWPAGNIHYRYVAPVRATKNLIRVAVMESPKLAE